MQESKVPKGFQEPYGAHKNILFKGLWDGPLVCKKQAAEE
jgi:hypothetical protein